MDPTRFDRLARAIASPGTRRGLLRRLALLPPVGSLAAWLEEERAAAERRRRTVRRRRHRLHDQRKKKKKKCAKAGQTTSKKRKQCCQGLVKNASVRCAHAQPANDCVPGTCAPNACGSVPDGCGGTLSCGGCAGERICVRGVCQPCTVICTATPSECGTVLQNAMFNGGTIYVCPGLYQATFGGGPGLRVFGAGDGDDPANSTILDANETARVLTVNSGTVELERLRLRRGKAIIGGGGILLQGGTLRITECTVSGNIVPSGSPTARGGGIFAQGSSTLEMTRCTVRDNHVTGAPGLGGGISTAVTTTLTDCLVENNSASDNGGGLFVAAGTTTLLGTTQVRNNAADFGAGIYVDSEPTFAGTLIVAETCRVTANTALATGNGGGIYNDGGVVTLQGTANPFSPIVVDNCLENCAGPGAVNGCSTVPPDSC